MNNLGLKTATKARNKNRGIKSPKLIQPCANGKDVRNRQSKAAIKKALSVDDACFVLIIRNMYLILHSSSKKIRLGNPQVLLNCHNNARL